MSERLRLAYEERRVALLLEAVHELNKDRLEAQRIFGAKFNARHDLADEPCPRCGETGTAQFRLTPQFMHYGKMECGNCGKHLVWVKYALKTEPAQLPLFRLDC